VIEQRALIVRPYQRQEWDADQPDALVPEEGSRREVHPADDTVPVVGHEADGRELEQVGVATARDLELALRPCQLSEPLHEISSRQAIDLGV